MSMQGRICYKMLANFYEDEKDFVKYVNDNFEYKKINDYMVFFIDNKKKILYIIQKGHGLLQMTRCKDIDYYCSRLEKEDEEIFK